MRRLILAWLTGLLCLPFAHSQQITKQPPEIYAARRHALADHLQGGWAIIASAEQETTDFTIYRQDPDFYYLTGWNQPGAVLVVSAAGAGQPYREILFLPDRDLLVERFTGPKLDSSSTGVTQTTGVAEVAQLAHFTDVMQKEVYTPERRYARSYFDDDSPLAHAAMTSFAAILGRSKWNSNGEVRNFIRDLRTRKDAGELDLLKHASDASMEAHRAMMKAIKPGMTERDIAGLMTWKLMQNGCERVSYAPIVGSGPNSTVLHYSLNGRTMQSGDVVVIDVAGEYSMYSSDITRTVPVGGHFTDRQRELYNVVLGAQRAAAEAFVAGKYRLGNTTSRGPNDPPSLDRVAYDYINSHGKDLHGQPLGQYFVHSVGHSVGIDVHDPIDRAAVLDKGMVFTIEPGIYIPEENIGIRIEDVFWVDNDGKLHDFIADLPHTAEDVEAATQAR
jgi:Xaa-Pro aminopeptidase